MRSNGWQLPYHPLQVVAIAVFLALGFAFYVFFLPFVGKKLLHYVVMGLYTPLVASVFCLYVWCAATDPGDPGVFKSKKYLNIGDNEKKSQPTRQGCEWMSSINETDATKTGNKPLVEGSHADTTGGRSDRIKMERSYCCNLPIIMVLFSWFPFSLCTQLHSCEEFSEQQMSEDGMFFCSLCEVEVFKYSKHCRVCDKCVDGFDHHCRWLNNCIGKRNYQRFFILMVSALLLLILQWSIGVLVLILCFLDRKQFSVEITSKLGSSFSLVPFIVVVGCCTFLAMVATLPLAQLFFFHVLLIKKGISTYDYIIALREREQQGPGSQQSPQMSPVSSFTGLSATSSFNAFHHAAWCTPPRLFVEDQFDVIPPETMSVCSVSKRMMVEEPLKKRSTSTIRISPWTLARLNAQEVSRAASEARKKSKILQPVWRREMPLEQEGNNSFGSSSDRLNVEPDMWRGVNKRDMYQMDLPLEPLATISATAPNSNSSGLTSEASSSLAPLQLEARSAFRTSHAMSSTGLGASSPDSSLESPELHPFRIPSSGAEEAHAFESLSLAGTAVLKAIQLSRSTSDGYEASGGEDSDRVPSGIVHRSSDWSNLLLHSEQSDMVDELKASPSIATSLQVNTRRL